MFGIHSDNGYREIIPGIKIKTLNHGERMLMTEFVLEKDSILPEHSHACEQTGYLISGQIELFIDGKSRRILPGDNWNIKENLPHKAIIIENSVAIEIFNPVRQDYLDYSYIQDIVE